MSGLVPIPLPVSQPTRKSVWIELQYPAEGKQFVQYGSAGPQYIVRIHKDDKVIGEYLRYCYDGFAGQDMTAYLDKTLMQELHQKQLV